MHEIERLDNLLDKCKIEGCSQDDVRKLGQDHITGGDGSAGGNTNQGGNQNTQPQVPVSNGEKKFTKGVITFPDCGPIVSESCFWLHYQRSSWLDFLSVFGYIPGLLGCVMVFDEYEYGLCLGNMAYVIVDAYAKYMAPPDYFG